MKSLFNSLGSHYSFFESLSFLQAFLFAGKSEIFELEAHIKKTYSQVPQEAHVVTVYKGRDAIQLCLQVLLPKSSQVITQAFTCHAVQEAIVKAGMKVVFADITAGTSNLSVATLTQALQKNPQAQAVLVQHSLGIPADSYAIKKWCTQHNLLFIEDLAQGIGGVDSKGIPLGVTADAVVFSFGRDKIIDAVAGGAVLFKNPTTQQKETLQTLRAAIVKLPFSVVFLDALYPFFTWLIRATYDIGIGKIIFVIAQKLTILNSAVVSRTNRMSWMHPVYARFALTRFATLNTQLTSRKEKALAYFSQLQDSEITLLHTLASIEAGSNLRFSVVLKDSAQVTQVVRILKQNNIHVSDRWYRKAVDSGNQNYPSEYVTGSCPNAEFLAERVLNLPTHRFVTKQHIETITTLLKQVAGEK